MPRSGNDDDQKRANFSDRLEICQFFDLTKTPRQGAGLIRPVIR